MACLFLPHSFFPIQNASLGKRGAFPSIEVFFLIQTASLGKGKPFPY